MPYQNSAEQLRVVEQSGFRVDYSKSSRFPWLGFGDIPPNSEIIPTIVDFLEQKTSLKEKYATLIGEGMEPLSAAAQYQRELIQLSVDAVTWTRSLRGVQGARHAANRLDEII